MLNILTLLAGITLMYSTPLIFGALGGVISERSGVTNIGIEGMMTIGAFVGATVGYYAGNPLLAVLAAADTLGINVYATRYTCVILSGMLAGIAGSSITLDIVAQFSPTAVAGQGFIALAAVIFGKWKPMGTYCACLIFGLAQALTVVLGGGAVAISSELLAMLPYILTIIILILFVGKSVAPKANGIAYEKGKR